ncbi:general secretion pathway protein GspB [Shewanella sp. WPAGA9]|uniref:general secretion pathway protein GspB n=1 Tax=Shewanella sp. ENK2 TaxID=2775245 RepID=UPI00178032AC|nr:general secretion pathway protein GspB [Shewanella sp. WPAGA9]
MSILLDAVTKEKQQQMGELPDAVLTPRANYQQVGAAKSWVKYLLLIAVIIIGILAAWGLAKLLKPDVSGTPAVTSSQVNVNSAEEKQAEIRIANKVALPVAKPLNQPEYRSRQAVNQREEQSVTDVVYDYRLSDNRGVVTASQAEPSLSAPAKSRAVPRDTTSNSSTETLAASVSRAAQAETRLNESPSANAANNDIPLTAAELQALYGEDAIILGANSNYKTASDLDALKLKVSAAASDVNFEQQAQAPQQASINPDENANVVDNSNNLMAAFEAALKEVEYEQSANAPVTEQKLDPIPEPKKDEIPRYGQLPASVQLQVPEFSIQAHVYSSAAENRWLNVDGKELQEGDSIKGKLKVIEIRPRDVVLEIDGEQFKVPAI